MNRPGFLHTSPVHVATFDALLAEVLPGTRAVHLVDESFLADAREFGPEAVAGRVAKRLEELRAQGATVVCCTCSTIGAIAERAVVGIPVFRVDRPMAALAVRRGPRIGVVAALPSTLEPTEALLREEAVRAGTEVVLFPVVAEDAWEFFEAGNMIAYGNRVAKAARTLLGQVDVIVLAQASMADAVRLLARLGTPVLASPRAAVAELAGRR